ncbi:MAG: DUF2383 domain-containing protein, partial [Bdellovibrionales bacterium]|nr:DUF2383 domain-containing protein [Bdellovibrionales bacterium]
SNKLRYGNQMNEILRGEISAFEAYQQVLDKVSESNEKHQLETLLQDHRQAVDFWKKKINSNRMLSADESGPWGKVVETFIGTAKLFGNTNAIRALKEGEKHGLKEYESLMEIEDFPEDMKRHVKDVFIPNQKRHIKNLESLMTKH